jgi:subtilisin family serine protease
MAPHVINNSWSCPEKEGCNPDNFDLLNEAVYNLRQAGIVVVSSAGNDGSGCGTIITPPAIFDESFVVGAIGSDDTIAGFSSRGPVMVDSSSRTKPDVVAPGIWINSSIPGSTYGVKSGTSMAGPHVTGLVALLISAVPELAGQVSTIEHIIESSARVMTTNQDCGDITGQTIPNNTYGYGIVNALEAVRLAKASTAVENQTNRKFALYPNPFYRRINWKLSEKQPQKIEIHDLQGRILVSKNIKPFETNIEADLPPGIYFVTSYISNLKYVTKMVRN